MKKLKILLLALVATISLGAFAETDVTNLLNDAAIASEANWGGGSSSGGNHSRNSAGYWESWRNTFTLTQTINGLAAGYYMVSIQGVVEGGSTETAVLTATSGSNTATAYLRNNTRGDFNQNAQALKASLNLHRSYATVQVAEGGSLTISFKQTATNQWIVYGQFKLHKLTEEEGVNQQTLEAKLPKTNWSVVGSGGPYQGLNEKYFAGGGEAGYVMSSSFSDMPKGIYEVSVTAAASYTSGRGIEGKTGDNLTVFRVNEVDVNVPVVDRTAVDYSAYTTYTVKSSVGDDGNLKFGLYNLVEKAGNWFIFGINNIKYYGDLETAFAIVKGKAKDIIDAKPKMGKTEWDNLNSKYNDYKDAEATQEAIDALNDAIDAANISIELYAKIKVVIDKVDANISADGKTALKSYTDVYDNGTATETTYNDFLAAYIGQLKANPKDGADMTELILNPSFEDGLNNWGKGDASLNLAVQTNASFALKDGNKYIEFWQPDGTMKAEQTISNLHTGVYEVSVAALARGIEYANLYINDVKAPMEIADKAQRYVASLAIDADASITIGVEAKGSKVGSSWFAFDDFKLTLVSASLPDVTKAVGKMNKEISDAQDAAVNTYNGDRTIANYNAALAAIEAAKASIAIYEQIAVVNAKAATLDADGQKAYATTLTAYNEGTLSTLEEAINALRDAVKAQTTVGSDWSALGGTDKSAWDGATGNYATNYVEKYADNGFEAGNVLTQTIEGLMPYAKYEVKFTAVASHARGLTEEAHGDGIAQVFANDNTKDIEVIKQDACDPTDSKYQYTLEGHVNEDGKLTFGLKNIKAGGQWYVAQFTSLILKALPSSFDATLTTVGDAAYSTMYLDFPVEIPENVEAYYVTVSGKTATMNPIEGVIPANCGVILKAAEDVDKITFTQTSTKATTDVSDNVLIGFVKDTEVNNGKAHYAFSYKNDKVAFYIPASAESDTDPTSKFTAKANKAYIELEGTPSAKLDITWGGETTGINTIDNGQLTIDNSNAYNLNGMRVSEAYKGIVLKGGKKFLQK